MPRSGLTTSYFDSESYSGSGENARHLGRAFAASETKTQTPFRSMCLLLERIAFALIERANGLVVVAFLVDFHVCAE